MHSLQLENFYEILSNDARQSDDNFIWIICILSSIRPLMSVQYEMYDSQF